MEQVSVKGSKKDSFNGSMGFFEGSIGFQGSLDDFGTFEFRVRL